MSIIQIRQEDNDMKKVLSLILAALLMLSSSLLFACGEGKSETGPDTEGITEENTGTEAADDNKETEADTPAAPADEETKKVDVSAPNFEYVYKAPADGSFKICGTDLSEYTITAYCPNDKDAQRKLMRCIGEDILAATGLEIKVNIAVNKEYIETPQAEHEILFGADYVREGMPERGQMDSDYGVTEGGTVYFRSFNETNYVYMFRLFLEEFLGYEKDSGVKSSGCDISAFSRKLPEFDLEKLESAGYVLVCEDNFDGDSLDTDLWDYRGHGKREGGYLIPSQVKVENGEMKIVAQYLEGEEFGDAWYTAAIALKKWYSHGYFETRMKSSVFADGGDFSSAFWIQGTGPYDAETSRGGAGPGGAELDIMENFGIHNASCNIWIAGYDGKDGITDEGYHHKDLNNDYTEEFHTFALLWDEDYYRFYYDGVLIACTDFGYGTSSAEEQVIFSLYPDENIGQPEDTVRTLTADYIRIWQIPEAD